MSWNGAKVVVLRHVSLRDQRVPHIFFLKKVVFERTEVSARTNRSRFLELCNSFRLFLLIEHKFCPSTPDLVTEHLCFEEEGRHGHNSSYGIT